MLSHDAYKYGSISILESVLPSTLNHHDGKKQHQKAAFSVFMFSYGEYSDKKTNETMAVANKRNENEIEMHKWGNIKRYSN